MRGGSPPFLDVELTARFIGPNGETLTLAGYWDGALLVEVPGKGTDAVLALHRK